MTYHPKTGEDAITRDGRRVTQITILDASCTNYTVRGVLDKKIVSWTDEGWFSLFEAGDPRDLVGPWEDQPTIWRDMTPEEKGALLLAHHEGKVIEDYAAKEWSICPNPAWHDWCAYRVRPDSIRETYNFLIYKGDDYLPTKIGTIDMENDKPVWDSIKLENNSDD